MSQDDTSLQFELAGPEGAAREVRGGTKGGGTGGGFPGGIVGLIICGLLTLCCIGGVGAFAMSSNSTAEQQAAGSNKPEQVAMSSNSPAEQQAAGSNKPEPAAGSNKPANSFDYVGVTGYSDTACGQMDKWYSDSKLHGDKWKIGQCIEVAYVPYSERSKSFAATKCDSTGAYITEYRKSNCKEELDPVIHYDLDSCAREKWLPLHSSSHGDSTPTDVHFAPHFDTSWLNEKMQTNSKKFTCVDSSKW